MVDKTLANHTGFPIRYVDMGDGTWAMVVSLGASASIDIGDVTLLAGSAIIGKVSPLVSTTFTATQVTVPATANGIAVLAANALRVGAVISNPGPSTVYVHQASTGVTTSNGFGIPGGTSYTIDSPLYTGALYGIVASGTQVVTVSEMT
jgi:hypothetical protein